MAASTSNAFTFCVALAESSHTCVEVGRGDAATDPAAAERRLVQNISWNASTLASDSIHSQRDNTSGSASLTGPNASSTPVVSHAAANAVAMGSEDSSRPLKKRRTALSPPPPRVNDRPEDLSCSASVDGPQSYSAAGLTSPAQSDEDSVEPRLNAMEVMHGQWVGGGAHLPHSAPPGRPTSPSFPGHHSVSCMHPEGDLVRLRSYSTHLLSWLPCCTPRASSTWLPYPLVTAQRGNCVPATSFAAPYPAESSSAGTPTLQCDSAVLR
jgi:hypothetical protein